MLGLVTSGPIVGLLAGGGAAFVTTRKGKVGAVMRSTGDTMADIGKSIKEFDRNHGVLDKTAAAIIKGNRWVSKQLRNTTKTNFGCQSQ
jgi:hypothetical protein